MNAVKTFLFKIGHYLLSIIRSLHKILCCRKRRETEYLLPMTVGHVIEMEQNQGIMYERENACSDINSQWETWPDMKKSTLNSQAMTADSDNDSQISQVENSSQEDFFKDMVPQIRKQKKIYVQNNIGDSEQENYPSNRLAMDPSAVVMTSELGIIEDNPSNWEDGENSEQVWDSDVLIREKKRAEQEKRRAEHQRRKQEKENRRASKPESLSSMMLSLSESKDKHKYS